MRVVLIVAAGLSLAGCSSTDFFKSTPPPVTPPLDFTPPGAAAAAAVGPGCKTPCSVQVPAGENFTVTYALAKYQPATMEVTVVKQSGADPILDPNPVVAELQPATPPKKPKRKPHPKPKAAAPAAQPAPAATASPPPAGLSPFPPVR